MTRAWNQLGGCQEFFRVGMQPASYRQNIVVEIENRSSIRMIERRKLMRPLPVKRLIILFKFDVDPAVGQQGRFTGFQIRPGYQDIDIGLNAPLSKRQSGQDVGGSLSRTNSV